MIDEYSSLSSAQEYSVPDIREEFTLPDRSQEYTVYEQTTAYTSGDGKKHSRVRRMILYTATAAVSVGLLATPAPEPEPEPEPIVEVEPFYDITCAVVRAEEPDRLYYDTFYNYAASPAYGTEDSQGYEYIGERWFLVDPSGEEIELPLSDRVNSGFNRECFMPEEAFSPVYYESQPLYVYRMVGSLEGGQNEAMQYWSDPAWTNYGNLGVSMMCVRSDSLQEGSLLKFVFQFRQNGVLKQMTAIRPIDFMPPEPESIITMETAPRGEGYSDVRYRLVFHPSEGDDHRYFFGYTESEYEDSDYINAHIYYFSAAATCIQSFCTRWYDAEHQFLHEGWDSVASRDEFDWPFPVFHTEGRDTVFEYDGLVRSDAEDPAAAYYSVELHVIDASTGWHYVFESEQFPVTD